MKKDIFWHTRYQASCDKRSYEEYNDGKATRTLGTLMSSGVLLIQAMEVVQKVLGNQVIRRKLTVLLRK